jgi:small neutral amino acid transporter SnatA (MarC family)
MGDGSIPWSTLFGLLFMTMGPIRAMAVFSKFEEPDEAASKRSLTVRSLGLVAIAFTVALVMGDQALARWGVGMPALVAAAGIVLSVLSLQSMIATHPSAPQVLNADNIRAADLAFPGLFPPIAVALPIIFSAAAPGLDSKAIIFSLGMGVLAINWLAMRHAKSIIEAIGPTPLQLLGAVFGVLQTALGIEFILDAYRML